MEGVRRQTLDERRQIIASVLIQAYFGHAHTQMSIWSDLQQYCESYFAVAENKREKESACPKQHLQSILVEIVLKHSLNLFPVSPKHKTRVLHWLAKMFHNHSVPLCKTLEKALLHDATDEPEPEFIFKTFMDSSGLPLVTLLEENRNLIGHGTTGLTTWQGAMFLADWAQNFEQLIKDKVVVELGSGTGLLGMTLLKTLPLKAFTFTDCHVSVLNGLIYNLKNNFPTAEMNSSSEALHGAMLKRTIEGPPPTILEDKLRSSVYHQRVGQPQFGSETSVSVRHLDWFDLDTSDVACPDVILGSDIVYDRSALSPLCAVLRKLLMGSKAKLPDEMPAPLAFVSCTERSHTTLDIFESEMKKHGLDYCVIHKGAFSPGETLLCSDVQHQPIRIYRIEALP